MRLKPDVKAWARSHGHGVHSPMAYRLITDALCLAPIYGYYGDRESDLATRATRRVAAALHPGRVVRIEGEENAARAVAALDDCAAVVTSTAAVAEAMKGAMRSGMTFSDPAGVTVAVGRRDLPLTHYRIYFT